MSPRISTYDSDDPRNTKRNMFYIFSLIPSGERSHRDPSPRYGSRSRRHQMQEQSESEARGSLRYESKFRTRSRSRGRRSPRKPTIQDRVGTPGCNTGTGHGTRCWSKTGPEEAYDKHRSPGKKASRDPKNNIREKAYGTGANRAGTRDGAGREPQRSPESHRSDPAVRFKVVDYQCNYVSKEMRVLRPIC